MIRREPQIYSTPPFIHPPDSPWGYPSSGGAHPCVISIWDRHLEGIRAVVRELELPLESLCHQAGCRIPEEGPRICMLASLSCFSSPFVPFPAELIMDAGRRAQFQLVS